MLVAEKYKKIVTTATALYLLAVLFCCFYKFSNLNLLEEMPFSWFDKLVHFMMFAPFVPLVSCFIAANVPTAQNYRRSVVVASIFGVVFALFTELVQALIPYRSFEWLDLVADLLSLKVFSALTFILFKVKK